MCADAFAAAAIGSFAERAAIAVGIENANDARNARLDGPAARIAGSCHGAHGGAVIGTITRDDFVASGEQPRHLHSVFVGFRAAQSEE